MGGYGMFGDPRRRRRRQAISRVLRFTFGALAVLGVGLYGYQVGISANQARSEQLEADLERLQRTNLELRDEVALVSKRSAEAGAALQSMRERYAAEMPRGEAAELLQKVRAQLAAGVEPERLAFLIEAAGQETCASAPVTKRFMPRTPISTGPRGFIRFDERIVVTGDGESARNEAGLAEAWYDPAKPIRLQFRSLDGSTTSIEGIVPFTHRMAVDGREYRFSVVRGEHRFVEVTAQACALPDPAGESTASAQAVRAREGAPGTDPVVD